MGKRVYKEVHGWLALGGVLVIALGAALFYHHSTNQSERTPTQEAEHGKVGVLCAQDAGPSDGFQVNFRHTAAVLNQKLNDENVVIDITRGDTEEPGSLSISKPFKVSAPAISTVEVGQRTLLNVCVILTKE